MSCELCENDGGEVLWKNELCRLVLVNDPDYPGFCRVILQRHVAEMTDLGPMGRKHFMAVVLAAEQAVREVMRPDKINLASLGNVVPHLHWHVIPRFREDRHFPNPIWGQPLREANPPQVADLPGKLRTAFQAALEASFPD
ncbi:MAG: HIT family protein [Sulfuricella sp.]|nr:HIT family protein [Sulfuricella sp.]